MDFSGCTQYTRAYFSEPKLITSLLLVNRITSVQVDGEILDTMLKDDRDFVIGWIQEHLEKKGQQVWEGDETLDTSQNSLQDAILVKLDRLARLAMNGKTISMFSDQELFDMKFQRRKELLMMTADSSVDKLLKKWRHINPKAGKDILTKEAMIDLEKKLKEKWLERLLSHFLKVQDEIPKLKKFGKDEDMVVECKALFGKRRWRTIKKYTVELEAILKTIPDFIPWDETKVRRWLNTLMGENLITPKKLATLWNTIRPLSKIFDFINPDGILDLKSKMERTMDELTEDKLKLDNRAMVPCVELVKLDERLSKESKLMTIRYYAACIRFALATSARGNDLQHTCPSTWKMSTMTRELKAWQTKTTTIHESNKRPIPLISPLHSFTGLEWWEEMDKVIDLFSKEEKFKDIDFLFPALTKDRTGFIPRPASNAQIMAIIRDELCKLVPPDTMWSVTDKAGQITQMRAHDAIMMFTFSGCRVFLPEWSNVADIPRELRRWLGRWREDSMADSYTRNHRGKIIRIMALLKGTEDLMNTYGEAPTDIASDHYLADHSQTTETAFSTDLEGWSVVKDEDLMGSPMKAARVGISMALPIMNVDTDFAPEPEDIVREDKEDEHFYNTRARLIKSLDGSKFPASQLPQQLDGPLSLVKTKVPSGPDRVKKLHLALTTRITVGCGMKATKCDVITEHEVIPLQATLPDIVKITDTRVCSRCFKFFYWDATRDSSLLSDTLYDEQQETMNLVISDSDSMPSASGDSSNSNDSESEAEAFRPTLSQGT